MHYFSLEWRVIFVKQQALLRVMHDSFYNPCMTHFTTHAWVVFFNTVALLPYFMSRYGNPHTWPARHETVSQRAYGGDLAKLPPEHAQSRLK